MFDDEVPARKPGRLSGWRGDHGREVDDVNNEVITVWRGLLIHNAEYLVDRHANLNHTRFNCTNDDIAFVLV